MKQRFGDKVGLGKDKATIIGPSVIYGPGYWYIEFDDGGGMVGL